MSVKEQVRMLWATCFHDSEAFMDLYFGCRYADSLNEYMESDGQVIAALQRIPYRLTYEGMNVPVAYISVPYTKPDRSSGYCPQTVAPLPYTRQQGG